MGEIPQPEMICPATNQVAGQHQAALAAEIGATFADLGHRIAELPRGGSYHVVLSQPVGGALNPRKDGLYDAFVKGPDGKIIAVARLSEISPGLLASVSVLAGHAMLVQISSQLKTLQNDINLLLKLQIAGDLGRVKSAIISLRTIQYYGNSRSQMLALTIDGLQKSIGGALQQAAELIQIIPQPPKYNATRLMWDTSSKTVRAIDRARQAVMVVFLGLQALSEAQVLLNENLAAAQIMREWLKHVQGQLDLARCERFARMMPANTDGDRHEVFWMRVDSYLKESIRNLDGLIEGDAPLRISLKCKAEDFSLGQ
ncbi:hypothetical protein M0638_12775 [Roseomonas sp. NAR14]|uniref:Uncharacterized protein n=1 Tax=Roseomonas acroporae TaxID=2937791 RepID=A0A9X1Y779_9PROT|nr:hypothetical protein [Roseomonas acroporae]MCK8785259.1 hypothetical protein [Roseomonas acroporae]